jgi:hypothetical protein
MLFSECYFCSGSGPGGAAAGPSAGSSAGSSASIAAAAAYMGSHCPAHYHNCPAHHYYYCGHAPASQSLPSSKHLETHQSRRVLSKVFL